MTPRLPFDAPLPATLAGRTDPPTSHAAARALRESGDLGRHQREVLSLVRLYRGLTAPELGELAVAHRLVPPGGEPRQYVGRRLSELQRAGLVRAGEPKRNPATGKACSTWWPA